ncbi:hypothetical protein C0Q70_21652 [Pomacea canaliculata]|uniref:Transmembrane 9 superfamily member n=1 Tax=Pomacea canaliculata TaxID=400727 RepID=A0A2T7ND51_POMCA|nr:hypothetical protein C0Q70_21652 [Pomacea canaliculata]
MVTLETVYSFYLPGLAPVTYCEEAQVNCPSSIAVYVNRLNSIETVIPYEYHSFDFCTDVDETQSPVENLGQVVFGERIRPSKYSLTFNKNETCKTACQKVYKEENKDDVNKLNFLKKGISLNYQHHWIIDNMPLTWCYQVEGAQVYCSPGFPVGCYVTSEQRRKDACVINSLFTEKDTYYLFNHVDLLITYHPGSLEDWGSKLKGIYGRIVSAKVVPRSIKHPTKSADTACAASAPVLGLKGSTLKGELRFNYTYSVYWTVS